MIGIFKEEFGGKIIKKFVGLCWKYGYLMDHDNKHKKAKAINEKSINEKRCYV